MRSKYAVLFLALHAMAVAGCSQPAGTGTTAASSDESPAQATKVSQVEGGAPAAPKNMNSAEGAVFQFLEAVRTGDDKRAEAMFSNVAREKIQQMKLQVAPPGSDTARFEIGRIEYLSKDGLPTDVIEKSDGARVEATWSDLDKDGNRQGEKMLWMVRREADGWRIAGAAASIFPGEDPVLLNFENLEEALQKVEKMKEEIARRDAKGSSEAQGTPESQPTGGADQNPPQQAEKTSADSATR